MEVIEVFRWIEGSTLAGFTKSEGGVFAVVQSFHLASLVVLGGMLLLLNLRLLGVLMRDVAADVVVTHTRRWIGPALIAISLTGTYMATAVAMKLYHNEFFWTKMTGLVVGITFLYAVQFPLLDRGVDNLGRWTPRLLGAACLMTWFSVAAAGRWIGFS